ncbi:hypothetical protein ABZP36_000050 [Zizania latifolia]
MLIGNPWISVCTLYSVFGDLVSVSNTSVLFPFPGMNDLVLAICQAPMMQCSNEMGPTENLVAAETSAFCVLQSQHAMMAYQQLCTGTEQMEQSCKFCVTCFPAMKRTDSAARLCGSEFLEGTLHQETRKAILSSVNISEK